MTAIFSGVSRKGVWHPEPVTRVLAVFGGAELDYRDAVLPGPEIVLDATAVLGGVEIIVPPEMRVVDNGTAILGGREITGDAAEAVGPDSPLLRIEGICVLGGIEVKRKARKVPKALRRARESTSASRPILSLFCGSSRPTRTTSPASSTFRARPPVLRSVVPVTTGGLPPTWWPPELLLADKLDRRTGRSPRAYVSSALRGLLRVGGPDRRARPQAGRSPGGSGR